MVIEVLSSFPIKNTTLRSNQLRRELLNTINSIHLAKENLPNVKRLTFFEMFLFQRMGKMESFEMRTNPPDKKTHSKD